MGRQYNKIEKRRRRQRAINRKKDQARTRKASKPASAASAA